MLSNKLKYILCAVLFSQTFLFSAPIYKGAWRHIEYAVADSLNDSLNDSITNPIAELKNNDLQLRIDSLNQQMDSLDSVKQPKKKAFLEDIITGKNKDSLIYNVRTKKVHIFKDGEVKYQATTLKADIINIDMARKDIRAYGVMDTIDSAGVQNIINTRPVFVDGGTEYTMDTINYNMDSKKAKIKGVFTKEGEGFLHSRVIKKMPNDIINLADGKYTTCDDPTHPHFYMAMTKAKVIPGKKIVTGPVYLVFEDVPVYFLGLPFGFFPVNSSKKSGFIIPTFGEERIKGFFLRDGGYYISFNDYVDMTLTGGIYTKGSWDAAASSRYMKRYKYSGDLQLNYSKNIISDPGSTDYVNSGSFRVMWSHRQDPKFSPNSTFAASVNFSTSGYNKFATQNLNDYLNTQTNSSISYSKNWAGTPFSFSTNLQHSQNSQDSTVSLSLPNLVFNVSRIFPFQRKGGGVGKQRWYEKIGISYAGNFSNNVKVKERDLFSQTMLDEMKTGVNHTIPLSFSFNLFNHLNISPSANYQERWYFKKIVKEWNKDTEQVEIADTTYGFYRVWDYSVSASASTRIYGMFQFGPKSPVLAIRHVMSPSVGVSFRPDFGLAKYGYYKPVQINNKGEMGTYSPYEGGMFGVPGSGQSASLTFSLGNTLEMKVRSKSDTTGFKKISILDNLNISSSYNFLADSLNLSPFSINGRTTLFKNFGINFNATLDPYQYDTETNRRINKFMVEKGSLGRLTNVSFSFGYSFNNSGVNKGAVNNINSANIPDPAYTDFFNTGEQTVDPTLVRQMMTSKYYDFTIPWNLGFNYSFNYSNSGSTKNTVQSLGFNASVTLTQKWGVTFNGGYDFVLGQVTPGTFSLTRDLHCWQMSFQWQPIGLHQSWSFNISVKAATLKDLKFDKSSSFYDNFYD